MRQTLGIIGSARGMVGSICRKMLVDAGVLDKWPHVRHFHESDAGLAANTEAGWLPSFYAHFIAKLAECDVLVNFQRDGYPTKIYPALREYGWQGIWVDTAGDMRMHPDFTLICQPANEQEIIAAYRAGRKNFVGSNCTSVALMVPGAQLFRERMVKSVIATSLQAWSGAGAGMLQAGFEQSRTFGAAAGNEGHAYDQALRFVDAQRRLAEQVVAGTVLPYIDGPALYGYSKEEAKFRDEPIKAFHLDPGISISLTAVRVPVPVCHSVDITMQLTEEMSLARFQTYIASASKWIRIVPNDKDSILAQLTPASIAGDHRIFVGRIRQVDPNDLTRYRFFVVFDQLMWGAALPPFHMVKWLTEELA